MNFLAHLYLSGDDPEIMLGNFIGDYVKGKNLNGYREKIRYGIRLHRAIDTLTDSHPATKASNALLREGYGKYSGVVTDILFDHILAVEWDYYSNRSLSDFTRSFYFQMLLRYRLLPKPVRMFLPFMIRSNRLFSYRTPEGINRALEIMATHTSLPRNGVYATQQLNRHYSSFAKNFTLLFSDLIELASIEFGINLPSRNDQNPALTR